MRKDPDIVMVAAGACFPEKGSGSAGGDRHLVHV